MNHEFHDIMRRFLRQLRMYRPLPNFLLLPGRGRDTPNSSLAKRQGKVTKILGCRSQQASLRFSS
jgi:hypothetical protein